MRCHGSIDPLASTIRNLQTKQYRNTQNGVLFSSTLTQPKKLEGSPFAPVDPISELKYSRIQPPQVLESIGIQIFDFDLSELRNVNATDPRKTLYKACTFEADTFDPDEVFMGNKVGARTYRYQPVSYLSPPAGGNWQGKLKYPATHPDGLLSFQSYDGSNIEVEIDALAVYDTLDQEVYDIQNAGLIGLGHALSNTKDLYVCAASRYFEYFTGIQTSLDPNLTRSESDQAIFDRVVSYGLALKADPNQDLKGLIRNIISSDLYRESTLRKTGETDGE